MRIVSLFLMLAVCWFQFVALTLYAPVNPGSIKANVVDENGLGMKDVTITATPTNISSGNPILTGTTGLDGTILLTGAVGGETYSVTATKSGYVAHSTQPVSVTVIPDDVVTANFTLAHN